MTAPKTIDLGALSAALEGRTKGEWNVEETGTHGADIFVGDGATMQDRYGTKWIAHIANKGAPDNAHAIVAAVNAVPDLVALARAAVAWREALTNLDEGTLATGEAGPHEREVVARRLNAEFDAAHSALLTLAARFSNTTGGDE